MSEQAEFAVKKSQGLQDHQRWPLIVLVLLLLAAAIIFLGNSKGYVAPLETNTPQETQNNVFRTYTVIFRNGVFSPTNLRIHAGDTVRFKNDGLVSIRISSDPHPDHTNLSGFDSIGDVPGGSFFSFTFAAKGTFGYHNEKDPAQTGTIIVR